MRRRTKNEKTGSALIVSILILILIVMIALSIALVAVQNQNASIGEYKSSQSFGTTDTILENTIYALTRSGSATVDQLASSLGTCEADGNLKVTGGQGEIELLDSDGAQIDCSTDTATALVSKIKSISNTSGQSRSVLASVICASPYRLDDSNKNDFMGLYHFQEADDKTSGGHVIIDASGQNEDGKIHGTIPFASGICKARKFDGSNYIEIKDNQVNSPIQLDGDMTISAWVKVDTTNIDGSSWYSIAGKGANYDLGFTYSNGWEFKVNGGGGGCDIYGNDGTFDDNWHLVTGTYDRGSGKVKLYVDDKGTVAEGDCSAPADTSAGSLYMGKTSGSGFGLIDEVRIEKKAESDTNVASDYTKGEIFNLP